MAQDIPRLEAKLAELLEDGREFRTRRYVVTKWIDNQDSLEWVELKAGVVCLPRLRQGIVTNPEGFYRSLAEDHKTFVIPGRCFGLDNSFFRLGFGGTQVDLRAGLAQLKEALDQVANV